MERVWLRFLALIIAALLASTSTAALGQDAESAAPTLQQTLQAESKGEELLREAQELRSRNDFVRALAKFQEAAALMPDRVDVQFTIAVLLNVTGDPRAAEECINRLSQNPELTEDDRKSCAYYHCRFTVANRGYNAAINQCQQYLAKHRWYSVECLHCQLLCEAGRKEAAIAAATQLHHEYPDNDFAQYNLLMMNWRKRSADELATYGKQLSERRPYYTGSMLLGLSCIQQGNWPEASKHLNDAVQVSPRDTAYAWAVAAIYLLERGYVDECEASCNRAISLAEIGNSPLYDLAPWVLYAMKGLVDLEQGDRDGCIANLEHSLRLSKDCDDATVRILLASTLYQRNARADRKRALVLLESTIQQNPGHAAATYLYCTFVLLRPGSSQLDPDGALAVLAQFSESELDANPHLLELVALARASQGDFATARVLQKRVIAGFERAGGKPAVAELRCGEKSMTMTLRGWEESPTEIAAAFEADKLPDFMSRSSHSGG